jgi:hypothetical protein
MGCDMTGSEEMINVVGDVVGMKVNLRQSCLSALHSLLFTTALGEHMDTVFWLVVESKRGMEFGCDETL